MRKVRIKLSDGRVIEGIELDRPSTLSNEFITVKLKNGYNIGIKKANIKDIEYLGEIKQSETIKKYKKDSKKPLLVVLHTGGTIASKVDYSTGGVVARISPDELVSMVPEIEHYFSVHTELVFNTFSENMTFKHYNVLIDKIAEAVKNNAKGIIIGHGTDTMHYTAAALHFALKLPIPVVLVGSQRSSDRPSSDAWLNIKGAVLFINEAIKKDIAGVFIAMHRSMSDDYITILPYKSRKMHTSRRDAFKPINSKEVAIVDVMNNKVEIIDDSYKKQELSISHYNENLRIGVLKVHPGLTKEEILFYKDFDALIIEGTGLGHFPVELIPALKEVTSKIPVIMTSQCIYGRINMNVYSTGRMLQEIGVQGNLSDLTSEATLMKIAMQLSKQ